MRLNLSRYPRGVCVMSHARATAYTTEQSARLLEGLEGHWRVFRGLWDRYRPRASARTRKRRFRPRREKLQGFVALREDSSFSWHNAGGVARRKLSCQSEANEGRYPPLPLPSCSDSVDVFDSEISNRILLCFRINGFLPS